MDKLKIKEEIKALYDDTEKCISNLVVSRGKRDEQGIADAHWHMESLMVNAQQMCSVILDSLQEEPSIPDIVDEHYYEMLEEEPVIIKKGCKYRCLSDMVNKDTGNISFIGDKIYLAPEDNALVSEENGWLCDTSENASNFELVEEPVSEDLEKAAECIELEVINDWTYGKDPDHAVIPAIHYRLPHTFNVGDKVKIKIEVIKMNRKDYEIRIKADNGGNLYWQLLRKGKPIIANKQELKMVYNMCTEISSKIAMQFDGKNA